MFNLDFIGLFIFIAGFIIGLGAVTVIDIHGFLGRKSAYWTEATIRTHKVTKPQNGDKIHNTRDKEESDKCP